MTTTPAPRVCTKCGDTYPATLEYFPKKGNGLGTWCRECMRKANREYRQKNKNIVALRQKERYHKDIEKTREKRRAWYEKRKLEKGEEVREYQRNWQRKRRAKIREVKTRALESDDYTDLLPANEHDWFRSWAVITSAEYGAHFGRETGLKYPDENKEV